ncbi:hypothetical protein THAOC_09600 [Thalassiosira oceanica]|uniref:Uncharacterized protein n=1 Tax=Thalassiosira oceanica TaxID=159749 RepID=K0SW53_THAOC|nr:hypothetical protein THAOC_09600 [Thalassiosira oceanica]|eukprot:EJK69174.1 hypothetical protein THAOC_09600 [Thalassiosira oceanica]
MSKQMNLERPLQIKGSVLIGRAALLGSKTETDKQTNKQTDKEQGCTKKMHRGKKLKFVRLALVLDSSRAEACTLITPQQDVCWLKRDDGWTLQKRRAFF